MPGASRRDAAPVRVTCKVTDLAQVPLSMSSSNFLNDMSESGAHREGSEGSACCRGLGPEDRDLRSRPTWAPGSSVSRGHLGLCFCPRKREQDGLLSGLTGRCRGQGSGRAPGCRERAGSQPQGVAWAWHSGVSPRGTWLSHLRGGRHQRCPGSAGKAATKAQGTWRAAHNVTILMGQDS